MERLQEMGIYFLICISTFLKRTAILLYIILKYACGKISKVIITLVIYSWRKYQNSKYAKKAVYEEAEEMVATIDVIRCPCHNDRSVQLYCGDHDTYLCSTCLVRNGSHKDCANVLDTIDLAYEIERRETASLLHLDMNYIEESCAKLLSAIDAAEDQVTDQKQKILAEFEEIQRDIIFKLNQCRNDTINCIDNHLNIIKQDGEKKRKRLTSLRRRTQMNMGDLQKLKDKPDNRQSMSYFISMVIGQNEEAWQKVKDIEGQMVNYEFRLKHAFKSDMLSTEPQILTSEYLDSPKDVSLNVNLDGFRSIIKTTLSRHCGKKLSVNPSDATPCSAGNGEQNDASIIKTTVSRHCGKKLSINPSSKSGDVTHCSAGNSEQNDGSGECDLHTTVVTDQIEQAPSYVPKTDKTDSRRLFCQLTTYNRSYATCSDDLIKHVDSSGHDTFERKDILELAIVRIEKSASATVRTNKDGDVSIFDMLAIDKIHTIISDAKKKRLIIVSSNFQYIGQKRLSFLPGRLAKLDSKTVIVCVIRSTQLAILSVEDVGKLRMTGRIDTDFHPKSVVVANSKHIFVYMQDIMQNWHLVEMTTNKHNSFEKTREIRRNISDLRDTTIVKNCKNATGQFLLVQCCGYMHSVLGFNEQGEDVFCYDVHKPVRITSDKYGNIIVSDASGGIHILGSDGLLQFRVKYTWLFPSHVLSLSHDQCKLYVGRYKGTSAFECDIVRKSSKESARDKTDCAKSK